MRKAHLWTHDLSQAFLIASWLITTGTWESRKNRFQAPRADKNQFYSRTWEYGF